MGVNGNCDISNQPLSLLNRYLAFCQNPLCKKMCVRYAIAMNSLDKYSRKKTI